MKKIITIIILVFTISFICLYHKQLMVIIMKNFIDKDYNVIQERNEYFKNENWNHVQLTDNFDVNSFQDILNIFYTTLDSGWDNITYYCSDEYTDCINDTENLINDNNILATINNFVPTYNTYNKIYVSYNSLGRVNVYIHRIYTDEQIIEINNKIDLLISKLIKNNMSDIEKIRTIHDYIINNTKYDVERAEQVKNNQNNSIHISNTAYGVLFNGKAICGGYTDTMALFLDRLGFKNYKISSATHIWNVVLINNEWKHLDLTWDDPISENRDILEHNFFLLSDEELENMNTGKHIYDKNIYKN